MRGNLPWQANANTPGAGVPPRLGKLTGPIFELLFQLDY
jgi:hypothetical protein